MNTLSSKLGISVPRSASKLVVVLGAVVACIVVLHRITAPGKSLQEMSRHGNDMVGKTVQVYWPTKREWYKARVTKYNVAGNSGKRSGSATEGTHTLVYEDDSVVNSFLHKLKYHVVYGRELVGHLISIYRPSLGFYKTANVTAFDGEDELHTLQFDDGGILKLALALEDFQLIFGKELVGKVIEIRRELRDEPLYASVLHYSEYKGTFVLAFADGTLQDIDLKGVSFEIVHNPASGHSIAMKAAAYSGVSLAGLVPEIEAGADETHSRSYDSAIANAAVGGGSVSDTDSGSSAQHRFHSAAEFKEDPLRGAMLDFVEVAATPGQIAILNQARLKFERGLQAHVKKHLDEPMLWHPCGGEHTECNAIDYCAEDGVLTVRFGHVDFRWIEKRIPLVKFPLTCNSEVFGSDPVVGRAKYCEIKCNREEDEVKKVETCSAKTLPFIHELAAIPMCPSADADAITDPAEQALLASTKPFCEVENLVHVTDLHLDCRYQQAFAKFSAGGISAWTGKPQANQWIDRAFVAFFAGPPTGAHAGMVTNLIRSVHMFSKYPIIVYAVNTTNLAEEWDPAAFPRLIVLHSNGFSEEFKMKLRVSFNFHKFRSMMIRVRTAIQLDADMLVAKNIDRLFDSTAKHVSEDYPYPILPVHWMSRMKGADSYADAYFVPYDGFRIRWSHAHPTWTYHALVFTAQALMAKLDPERWKNWVAATGAQRPDTVPQKFVFEDEDMLNLLLWRANATKQWCKWDVEPSVYEDFLTLNTNQPSYSDTVWYKNGIPLMMIGMHNTKDPIATDKLLGRMRREPVSNNYVYHQGTYFSNPFDVEKLEHVHCIVA